MFTYLGVPSYCTYSPVPLLHNPTHLQCDTSTHLQGPPRFLRLPCHDEATLPILIILRLHDIQPRVGVELRDAVGAEELDVGGHAEELGDGDEEPVEQVVGQGGGLGHEHAAGAQLVLDGGERAGRVVLQVQHVHSENGVVGARLLPAQRGDVGHAERDVCRRVLGLGLPPLGDRDEPRRVVGRVDVAHTARQPQRGRARAAPHLQHARLRRHVLAHNRQRVLEPRRVLDRLVRVLLRNPVPETGRCRWRHLVLVPSLNVRGAF